MAVVFLAFLFFMAVALFCAHIISLFWRLAIIEVVDWFDCLRLPPGSGLRPLESGL